MQPDNASSVQLHALRPETVATFLTQRLGSDVDVQSVKSVGHGEWSKAYYFRRVDGREFVARFSARDEYFLKDQRAMCFASPHLPIPSRIETGQAFDGHYSISERAYGDFTENATDHAAMQRLLPSLFTMLDACRGVDLSVSTGFGIWRGDGTAPHANWCDALLKPSGTSGERRA